MELPSSNLNIWMYLPFSAGLVCGYRKRDQLWAQPYRISPVLGLNNPLPQSASVLPFVK